MAITPKKSTQKKGVRSQVQDDSNTLWGHPKGLYVLFMTEMWERMSYYGMRALLVLYMVNHLFINPEVHQQVLGFATLKGILEWQFGPLAIQPLASQIYGLYTGLVYATPFFGGIIADRFWGQRKTVIVGGILMTIGHFLMAIESLFFVALCFLIIGNGAFKPNISTQVGDLYAADDSRRDGAFTLFYMGINLGAFLSPLVCGTLGQKVGWHWGFGAAGVGMILGLLVYIFGKKYIQPHPDHAAHKLETKNSKIKEPLSSSQWKAIFALVLLCALNIVFWGVYEQQGNTMQLWADNQTNWNFFGFEMPSTWYQSFNPLAILIFAPLLGIFWKKQASRNKEPSSVTKMAMGCLMLGAAFCIMILAASTVGEGRGSVLWLVVTTLVLTLGELYLSPVGLSLVTKVAPPRIVSMMMGMWFLSSFVGNYMSGYLGSFYETMPKTNFFGLMAVLAALAGLAMAAFNKPLKSALGNN
ncbi:MAG: peptide MFS transporter [Proteobacteria bacterium]|nr:peptide MFS transporter [Pseudomonadota bacterium]